MKNPLLIGITSVTLIALTATTIYAQVANTSIVDRMKAAVHAFTLSSDLNAGQTGYESAPVSGKKTGNMLTAAEWNRMLEIVSQGSAGGGGSCTPSSGNVYDSGWIDFQGNPVQTLTHNLGTMDTVVFMEMKSDKDYSIAHTVPITLQPNKSHLAYGNFYTKWYNKTENTISVTTANNIQTMSDRYVRIVMIKTSALGGGCGGASGGGDKFTFLDTQILLYSSGVTTSDKNTPIALDVSTIPGITIPANAKAVQLYVICSSFSSQNENVRLNLGRSPTTMLRVCQQNVSGATNSVDTNSTILPLADDKKTLYYSYNVPASGSGGQISIYLRGFITE